jgi:hypothetical protein
MVAPGFHTPLLLATYLVSVTFPHPLLSRGDRIRLGDHGWTHPLLEMVDSAVAVDVVPIQLVPV